MAYQWKESDCLLSIDVLSHYGVFYDYQIYIRSISLGRTAKASIGKFVDVLQLQHMQDFDGFEVEPNQGPTWETIVIYSAPSIDASILFFTVPKTENVM